MTKQQSLKRLTVTGMLCALAYLCMFLFRIKVQFLTFDAKDAILAITALLYGPVYGVFSSAIVAVLEFLSVSDTGVYGLIMNFLSSGTFALTCGLIYQYRRTLSGSILAVSMSVVVVTAVMMLANLLITPLFMGVDRSVVIAMLPTLLLPFNLAKSVMNAAITLAIYKPLVTGLKRARLLESDTRHTVSFNIKSVLLIVISVLVIVLVLLFLLLAMEGTFEFIPR